MSETRRDRETRCLLLDWGDTVMRVFPEYEGPMLTWPRVEAVEGTDARTSAMHRTIHSLPELPEALEMLLSDAGLPASPPYFPHTR